MRLILDSHPDISCGPETHFLSDLEAIVGRHWYQIELFGFEKDYWHTKIGEFFESFQMDYARARGKKRWADKTPKYARKLPFLNAVFPKSQFVHLIRDAYDVVASHRRRWGYRSAATCASRTWRESISMAREFGQTLPSSRYTELRYEQLVTEPESTVRGLLEYLEEPWIPGVLEYTQFDHDIHDRHDKLTEVRREEDSRTIYQSRKGAGKKELDAFLKLLLLVRSGSLMKKLGY